MGLTKEGEEIHDKMVIAATRQLSATTGGQYSRYIARLIGEYWYSARLCKKYRRFRT